MSNCWKHISSMQTKVAKFTFDLIQFNENKKDKNQRRRKTLRQKSTNDIMKWNFSEGGLKSQLHRIKSQNEWLSSLVFALLTHFICKCVTFFNLSRQMNAINCEMEKNRKWNRLEVPYSSADTLTYYVHYLFCVLSTSLSYTCIPRTSSCECAAACYCGSGGGNGGVAIIQSYSMYVNQMLHSYSIVNKFAHV